MRNTLLAIGVLAAGPTAAAGIASSVDPATVPPGARTALGLYLTPADAAAALAADPSILFIDVRDPIEVAFVGHAAPIDANIPVATFSHAFDPKAGSYKARANPDFVAQVAALAAAQGLGRDAPVAVICRSGGRSAAAAGHLIAAGFTNVWNVVEGFEGDLDKATGQRRLNGWRNAGLPWTYRLEAGQAWSATP